MVKMSYWLDWKLISLVGGGHFRVMLDLVFDIHLEAFV